MCVHMYVYLLVFYENACGVLIFVHECVSEDVSSIWGGKRRKKVCAFGINLSKIMNGKILCVSYTSL